MKKKVIVLALALSPWATSAITQVAFADGSAATQSATPDPCQWPGADCTLPPECPVASTPSLTGEWPFSTPGEEGRRKITAPFGPRFVSFDYHEGLDLRARHPTFIGPMWDGEIVDIDFACGIPDPEPDDPCRETIHAVKVKHPDLGSPLVYSVYVHLEPDLWLDSVYEGQSVSEQVWYWNTGRTGPPGTPPHLHLSTRLGGASEAAYSVNPMRLNSLPYEYDAERSRPTVDFMGFFNPGLPGESLWFVASAAADPTTQETCPAGGCDEYLDLNRVYVRGPVPVSGDRDYFEVNFDRRLNDDSPVSATCGAHCQDGLVESQTQQGHPITLWMVPLDFRESYDSTKDIVFDIEVPEAWQNTAIYPNYRNTIDIVACSSWDFYSNLACESVHCRTVTTVELQEGNPQQQKSSSESSLGVPQYDEVEITRPLDNSDVFVGEETTVLVSVLRPDIQKVELWADFQKIGEKNEGPWVFPWVPTSNELYYLEATATYSDGSTTDAAPASVWAEYPPMPPEVNVSSPDHGEQILAIPQLDIWVYVTDNTDPFPNVLVDIVDVTAQQTIAELIPTQVGDATGGVPWKFEWKATPGVTVTPDTPGTYQIVATARNLDNLESSNSSAIEITCGSVDNLVHLLSGPTEVELYWSGFGNASYTVEYREVGSGTWISQAVGSNPTLTLTGLSECTTYKWRVTGVDGACTVVSGSATFTTGCDLPVVTGLQPNWGYALSETGVTITGNNFHRPNDGITTTEVKFGNQVVPFNVVSNTSIDATALPGSGTVSVTVKTTAGSSSGGPTFFYDPGLPTIADISPQVGLVFGGETVVIQGSNFAVPVAGFGVTAVRFGAATAQILQVIDNENIVVSTPPGQGLVSVTVETTLGSVTSDAAFYYEGWNSFADKVWEWIVRGWNVGTVGDLDGDGFADVAVSDGDSTYVYDGQSGQLLTTITVSGDASQASSIASLGDINGDGSDDFALGFPSTNAGGFSGKVVAYSGSNFAPLWTTVAPDPYPGVFRFGMTIKVAGDTDGDGRLDLVVGANGISGAGPDATQAFILSGSNGAIRIEVPVSDPGNPLVVAGLGDVDDDGHSDFAVANWADENNEGFVAVIDGHNGWPPSIQFLNHEGAGDRYGYSLDGLGRLDASAAQFITGAPGTDGDRGKAFIYREGGIGVTLWGSVTGENPGDKFGERVAALDDLDGDGHREFAIGAPYYDTVNNAGRVYIYSPATGQILTTINGRDAGERFGRRLAYAGDVDGDGIGDLIVGAPDGSKAYVYALHAFKPVPTPAVSTFVPFSGDVAGGTTVTIIGQNFAVGGLQPTAVRFGNTDALSFSVIDNSHIEAVSPPGVGNVTVTVETPLGTATSSQTFRYHQATPPAVTGLLPDQGPVTGNTPVLISGTHFSESPTTAVEFGGIRVAFTVISDTQILAISPPGVGTRNVIVTNIGGQSLNTPADDFYYVPPQAGSLSFDAGQQLGDGPAGPNPQMVTGDFDRDGRMDVAVLKADPMIIGMSLAVLHNSSTNAGAIAFTTLPDIAIGGFFIPPIVPMAAGDINGDGWTDVVVVDGFGSTVYVLRNTSSQAGAIQFDVVEIPVSAPYSSQADDVVIADFSGLAGDGLADLVVAEGEDRKIHLYRNITTAPDQVAFELAVSITTVDRPRYLVAFDVDGDSRTDIISANEGDGNPFVGGKSVLLNASSGVDDISFEAEFRLPDVFHTGPMALADLDADGFLDLAQVHPDSNKTTVSINRSSPGSIDLETNYYATCFGSTPRDLAAGDYNLDGILDIAVACEASDSVWIWHGMFNAGGTYTFSADEEILTGSQGPFAITQADFNGDGLPDLATADGAAQDDLVTIFRLDWQAVGFPIELDDGWNLVGLSYSVPDSHYQTLFPNAVPNTLFGFDGAYTNEQYLELGEGYWLRMPQAETVYIQGEPVDQVILELDEGWNLISGPSCTVPVNQIIDVDGAVVPNTLFEFNGAYALASAVKPGKGYWIQTDSPGILVLSCTPQQNSDLKAFRKRSPIRTVRGSQGAEQPPPAAGGGS
jgi:hypothetical protein